VAPAARKAVEARSGFRLAKAMESDRMLAHLPALPEHAAMAQARCHQRSATVVVLGAAGSGKSRLIELDVDWRARPASSCPAWHGRSPASDLPGTRAVVHEVSTPLLEDGSKHALRALRRLWRASFGQRQALVVVTLDVAGLRTPTDEVRRVAHLLRGKINLVSETCQSACRDTPLRDAHG